MCCVTDGKITSAVHPQGNAINVVARLFNSPQTRLSTLPVTAVVVQRNSSDRLDTRNSGVISVALINYFHVIGAVAADLLSYTYLPKGNATTTKN